MQIETPQAVAIYCRLSKEDLDENKIDNLSRSIQNQKSMLTDFAEINGWQIFDIYCDDNLSGVARDRPEFNRLIRDASLRKFNIILFDTPRS
ncbi:recombinase family protein [Coprococcus comes]|uniref:recombinase family protein n=1 Tax=Coprococcus comes TaxID=410072 RepID=UPI00319DC9E5